MIKKLILMMFIIILTLIGCEEQAINKAIEDKAHVFNWQVSYMPRFFYPAMNLSDVEKQIVNNLYEGLTRVENDMVNLAMAETIDISENELTYSIKLKNTQWSDGKLVSTDDFVYSWERADNYFKYKNLLYIDSYIDYVEVIDQKNMKIHLTHPNPDLLKQLSLVAFMPVRQDVVDLNKRMPTFISDVTNGPYVLESYMLFSGMKLSKNIHYYDYYNVGFDHINITFNTDYDSVYSKYKNKQLDLVTGIDFNQLDDFLQNEDDFKLLSKSGVYAYSINSNREVLNDINVRRMLNISIDRSELNPFEGIINDSVAYSIFDEETVENLRKLSGLEFEFDRDMYAYNVTDSFADEGKINALVENFDPMVLEQLNNMTIITRNTPNDIRIAELLRDSWREYLGIYVSIETKDRYDYAYAVRTKSYDIILNSHYYVDYEPRHMLRYFLSDAKINQTAYSSLSFDTKLINAVIYSDNSLHKFYESIITAVDDFAIMIPIYNIYEPVLISSNLRNWSRSYEALFYFGKTVKVIDGIEGDYENR